MKIKTERGTQNRLLLLHAKRSTSCAVSMSYDAPSTSAFHRRTLSPYFQLNLIFNFHSWRSNNRCERASTRQTYYQNESTLSKPYQCESGCKSIGPNRREDTTKTINWYFAMAFHTLIVLHSKSCASQTCTTGKE